MKQTRRAFLAAGAALVAAPALAGPTSRLIAGPWKSFGSAPDPDHGAWASFLDRYLVPGAGGSVAKVRYAKAARDGARLTNYLGAMQALDPTRLSEPAAMAYWLNLYNAITVDLVLEAFPVDSIKEVRGGLFNTGPWSEKVVTVAGRELSLDDIEHGILRPIWRDPRIHYGVNCASIGCPDLDAKPFVAADLDARLNAAAKRYVDHPRGARAAGGGAVVSTIYDWFVEDFGDSEAGVIAHINKHRTSSLAGPVRDYEYDWSLNAA